MGTLRLILSDQSGLVVQHVFSVRKFLARALNGPVVLSGVI